jgi:hypothetical protein
LSYGAPRLLQVGKAEVYLRALGEGTIILKLPAGHGGSAVVELILTQVWYCPDCPFNLISTRRVVQAGHSIKLTSTGAAILAPDGRLAVWLEMDGSGLYSCFEDGPTEPPGSAGVVVEGSTLPPGMGFREYLNLLVTVHHAPNQWIIFESLFLVGKDCCMQSIFYQLLSIP